jgi:hypothetical protein
MPMRIALRSMVLALATVAMASAASGADTVKVAIGQIDAWANQAPTLGMKAGKTLQAVISGSADKLAPLQLIEWPRGIAWRTGNDQA